MKRVVSDGLVIVFEGVDGVGKSTQIERARQQLIEDGWDVIVTRNLGGTPIGELLREAMLQPVPRPPLTDLYISVAIQEALVEFIRQERGQGRIILMDRSPLSLAAYQIYGSGIDAETGWHYVEKGLNALRPELTLIYTGDIPTVVERARQYSAKADYFESKSLNYFEQVAGGYQEGGARYGAQFIDAERSIETVHADTMQLIQAELTKKTAA